MMMLPEAEKRWRQEGWKRAGLPPRFWEDNSHFVEESTAARSWVADIAGNIKAGKGFAVVEAVGYGSLVGAVVAAEVFKAGTWSGVPHPEGIAEYPCVFDWADVVDSAENRRRMAATGWLLLCNIPFVLGPTERLGFITTLRSRWAHSRVSFLHFIGMEGDLGRVGDIFFELGSDTFIR